MHGETVKKSEVYLARGVRSLTWKAFADSLTVLRLHTKTKTTTTTTATTDLLLGAESFLRS